MYKLVKRNGKIVEFDVSKISSAIQRAFEAQERDYIPGIIDLLALRVTADFQGKISEGLIHVEDVQDSVEHVLEESGYTDVAKAYILYRKQREKVRNVNETILDYKDVVNGYVNVKDWRVKENSTVTYSVGGLILNNSGAITANYWLSEVYDEEIGNAHRNADIHIHDLSMLTGYCAGWSLKQLIQEGLGGIRGKITSSPASHLSTLCNQMVNFLGIMQNEWAGAQAFSSFDTFLAPFVKVDHLSYKEVKQCIQSFIYGVNTPSRWGTQAPFTNITLDWTVPNDLAELNCLVGGKELDFKYKDCAAEMAIVNKAFIEIMIEGDANGRGFQYPIPTYSITKEFDWSETENNKLLFEMTAKYGTPYFSNYINSDMEPSDVRSMCCRLRLDLRELRKKSGGFFGSGESTGSIGVVTINLPRIAYLAKDERDFYKRLDKMMDISARSLKIKRDVISKLLDAGLYPYTKRYLGTFKNHFSTIGIVGMNEAGLNADWLKMDMTHAETQQFAKDVLNHMRDRLSDYQEEYGDLYNLEATPAESTSYRLAKHDRNRFPNIITATNNTETPYYTNSSNLPVGYTSDIFDALAIQDSLQTLYTSGTVFHAFLGEKLPDWKSTAKLVKTIAENFKLPYYTISPTYSVCSDHGYITGEHFTCPDCGKDTEVYSRITGYYRPVQNWNVGKTQEFKERKLYDVAHSKLPKSNCIPIFDDDPIDNSTYERNHHTESCDCVTHLVEKPCDCATTYVDDKPVMNETAVEKPHDYANSYVEEKPAVNEPVAEEKPQYNANSYVNETPHNNVVEEKPAVNDTVAEEKPQYNANSYVNERPQYNANSYVNETPHNNVVDEKPLANETVVEEKPQYNANAYVNERPQYNANSYVNETPHNNVVEEKPLVNDTVAEEKPQYNAYVNERPHYNANSYVNETPHNNVVEEKPAVNDTVAEEKPQYNANAYVNERPQYNANASVNEKPVASEAAVEKPQYECETHIQANPCESGKYAKPIQKAMLFSTKTCPNCVVARNFLNNQHFEYEVIYAEDNPELAASYSIFQAPTLVVVKGDEIKKYTNISSIITYVKSR